nr:hypothetical protein Iba_chr12dCG20770 [Ipomoea batatas]
MLPVWNPKSDGKIQPGLAGEEILSRKVAGNEGIEGCCLERVVREYEGVAVNVRRIQRVMLLNLMIPAGVDEDMGSQDRSRGLDRTCRRKLMQASALLNRRQDGESGCIPASYCQTVRLRNHINAALGKPARYLYRVWAAKTSLRLPCRALYREVWVNILRVGGTVGWVALKVGELK